MKEVKMKPIWYFVGLILLVMGGIIFLNGIYLLYSPPITQKVLSVLHPDIWWGGLMVLFGGMMFLISRKQTIE
jgi:hypothetical protein